MHKPNHPGMTAQEIKPALITCITAFSDSDAAATARQLGLPDQPACVAHENLDILWSGPRQWILIQWQAGDAISKLLAQLNQDQAQASVLDSGRIVFSIEGEAVSERLSSLVAIDLHPNEFKPGALATTAAAHMAVTIWRQPGGAWHLMGMRSYAQSLKEALSH